MKTRHVFSTPDVHTARTVMQAARAAGVPEADISLIARSDIELDAVPEQHKEAGSDFYPAALRGVVGGGAMGLLAGLVAVAIPPVGITVAGVAGLTAAGALTGAWSSALVGASVPDPVRRRFEDEIAAGRILVVIDGEKDELARAEPALSRAGGTPLPFEEPTALS